MAHELIVLFWVLIALIVGWSLLQACRTGRIKSRGWTFQRDQSPVGYWFVAVIDLAILVVSFGFAFHELGWISDLSATIQLPHFH
jgi:hypothetical protein